MASQKPKETPAVSSKEKKEMVFIEVYLPRKNKSDINILKDIMEKSSYVNVNKFGRSLQVGFDGDSMYIKAIARLLRKNYDGKTLRIKSFPSTYTPLKKTLLLPKRFTDEKAIISHFGASDVESKEIVIEDKVMPFTRHILSFPSREAADKAMLKSFIVNRNSYYLKPSDYISDPQLSRRLKKSSNKRNFAKFITP